MPTPRWPSGRRLALERARKGWTQAELAQRADLTTIHIGMMERGQTRGSVKSWWKVAQALDVQFDDLCDEVREPTG